MTAIDQGATDMPPSPASAEPVPIKLVLSAVAATLLFASLGQTIVSTALPVMVADLGGMDKITWVMTAYLLASTIGAPVAGKLGDLYGRKPVLQWGIGVFILGAVICGTATSMGMVIAGRIIQGAGGGGLIVTCMALVGDLLPARERGKAQAVLGAAFGISTVIGPLLGGFLVQNLSWHWIFFVNFPVGALAFIVLGIALPRRSDRSRKSVDYAGGALLATLLASLVLISNTGGTVFAWASPQVLALGIIALSALALFIRVERRAAEPILPMSLFANNTFVVMNAVGILVGMAMFGTITFLPFFLQVVKGISPTSSGLFLVPMMGGLLSASILSGRYMARTGRYKFLPVASTALLSLSLLSMTTLSVESPLWVIALSMVGIGLGLGPVFAIGVAAIQNAIPVSMLGVGTASANMFRLIGGAVGTAAFGALFSTQLARSLEGEVPGMGDGGVRSIGADMVQALPHDAQVLVMESISQALHPVFWIAAGAALLACLASLMLRELPLSS
ncbi:MDR family MFS transporter [Salipiger bermudensis]|uniref:MDR family MFS transporter n=1 Tax=Salipiger bermudensis TaxID=344736 RepID=UPI001A8ECD80|nr:MDR family MFS transporter [Salipiger bermudensis]MBN9677765.1 MFS transporter [Salipiger bermudensis]